MNKTTKKATYTKTKAWEIAQDYMKNGGIKKYFKIMNGLDGKDYLDAYKQIADYFLPKLTHNKNENTNKNFGFDYKEELEKVKQRAKELSEISDEQKN